MILASLIIVRKIGIYIKQKYITIMNVQMIVNQFLINMNSKINVIENVQKVQ